MTASGPYIVTHVKLPEHEGATGCVLSQRAFATLEAPWRAAHMIANDLLRGLALCPEELHDWQERIEEWCVELAADGGSLTLPDGTRIGVEAMAWGDLKPPSVAWVVWRVAMADRYLVVVETDERGAEYVGPMSWAVAVRLSDRLDARGVPASVELLTPSRSYEVPSEEASAREMYEYELWGFARRGGGRVFNAPVDGFVLAPGEDSRENLATAARMALSSHDLDRCTVYRLAPDRRRVLTVYRDADEREGQQS